MNLNVAKVNVEIHAHDRPTRLPCQLANTHTHTHFVFIPCCMVLVDFTHHNVVSFCIRHMCIVDVEIDSRLTRCLLSNTPKGHFFEQNRLSLKQLVTSSPTLSRQGMGPK